MISVDRRTVIQIFGSLMQRPSLLSDIDKYQIEPNDFQMPLDKYIYSAIYNLYAGGAESIHTIDIETYLRTNESAKLLFEKENGIVFLQDCETYCEPENFQYYYNRLKKIALLRELQKQGHNIDEFYCEDSLDLKAAEVNERFEQLTTSDIINRLKGNVAALETKYDSNSVVEESKAYTGVRELFNLLGEKPEIGIELQGDIFNTITRGGRKGKLYLRSGGTSVGKTRQMVGDACKIAYPIRYEPQYEQWIATGGSGEKVLYIMTEQDPAEIQTMILAYLTGINEEIFLYGLFRTEHMDRIMKALDIMEKYQENMLFARIPDPCSSIVKNLFRRYSFQFGIENFFYDYIFSSPAMLNEYRDLKVREDICLRLFTTTLKNLAVELNAFIMTSTQVSNDDGNGGFKDFKHIQGSRAIANLVDFACVMSRPTNEELNEVEGFQSRYNLVPNLIIDVFKNRRGRWTICRIWCANDLGTCRRYDLFVTTYDNKPIEEFQIVDFEQEKTKEMQELENYYNWGVPTTEMEKTLGSLETFKPNFAESKNPNLVKQITEAFGTQEERKKQLHDMDWSDLI